MVTIYKYVIPSLVFLVVACLLWHGFGREFYHEMCLSKLPRDAVPLSAEEEAAWVDSLQGDWDIEAVDLEAIAQTNNRYVKPIGFKTAKVTGKAYVCVCVCAYKGIKRM